MPEAQTGATCENLWKKMIGKPYSGKLNVRFDEGELEIEPSATTPALYSTVSCKKGYLDTIFSSNAVQDRWRRLRVIKKISLSLF